MTEDAPLKLVEAMKRLKLLEKRMSGNWENITKYSSQLSHEKLVFNTAEEQSREVDALVQSTNDLVWEYMNLKAKIDYTNLYTRVTIRGREYTLAQMLLMKRKLIAVLKSTCQALNSKAAESRLHRAAGLSDGTPISVLTFFDEKKKNADLLYWMEVENEIDSKLEVVNATTDLLEIPELVT